MSWYTRLPNAVWAFSIFFPGVISAFLFPRSYISQFHRNRLLDIKHVWKTAVLLPSEQLSRWLNPSYVTSITEDEKCFKVTVVAMQDGVGKQVDTWLNWTWTRLQESTPTHFTICLSLSTFWWHADCDVCTTGRPSDTLHARYVWLMACLSGIF